MTRPEKEWAIYQGDNFLFMGTTSECAKYLKVKNETIRFYSTPAYHRKLKMRNYGKSIVVVDVTL